MHATLIYLGIYFPEFTQEKHDFHTHESIEMLFVIDGTFLHVPADRTYDESAGGLTTKPKRPLTFAKATADKQAAAL